MDHPQDTSLRQLQSSLPHRQDDMAVVPDAVTRNWIRQKDLPRKLIPAFNQLKHFYQKLPKNLPRYYLFEK